MTVGVVPKSTRNPCFEYCHRGAQEAAEELGSEPRWDGPIHRGMHPNNVTPTELTDWGRGEPIGSLRVREGNTILAQLYLAVGAT